MAKTYKDEKGHDIVPPSTATPGLPMLVNLLRILGLTAMVAHVAMGQERPNPLVPYRGPSHVGVDTTTLTGKVMTGYQGWFNCENDGMGLGWTHWARNPMQAPGPGNVTVDLWPDMTEFTAAERFATAFENKEGTAAEVFSSAHPLTVRRHFRWMREYAIDGAFVQRFANGLASPALRYHKDTVLAHCRDAAHHEGRAYAVMYDLSGLRAGEVQQVIEDWRMLRREMELGKDHAYLKHRGKPIVAIWGIGFNDNRAYTLSECRALVEFLKADHCAVMLGVPTGWRELNRDAVNDEALHRICELADVLSPWSVGRYRNPQEARDHGQRVWQIDQQWCQAKSIDYLPVVFPGFSWHNLKSSAPLGQIPRLKGQFFWSQFVAAKAAGASMIYVAMFDEVDEGTAIFKCTNTPPGGSNPFLTYEGLPSDHYLWLTQQGGKLLREASPSAESLPQRN